MKKGLSIIFLIFAIVFTLPMILLFADKASVDAPIPAIIIFTVVDMLMWALFVGSVVKSIKNKKVADKGKEYTATFVSFATNLMVNNVPMFFITYVWENENGEKIEGKSASDYTIHEAEAFERAKHFKIKVLGNDSIIVTQPSQLIAQFKVETPKTQDKIVCEYCNSLYSAEKTKCPSCGAQRKNI